MGTFQINSRWRFLCWRIKVEYDDKTIRFFKRDFPVVYF